ncbi:MAG: hypothetical protein JXQ90_17930 [Cyclobacteriaceae bacterium]
MSIINEDNFNRLAPLLIEKDESLKKLKFTEAYKLVVNRLSGLKLGLVIDKKVADSIALQSAVINAVNTGKRAFMGGVFVSIEEDFASIIPGFQCVSIKALISQLGGVLDENQECNSTLHFGCAVNNSQGFQVVCNGWQGGVLTEDTTVEISQNPDFSLGGILASSLGVGLSFLYSLGLKKTVFDKDHGLSLWRPDLNWLDKEAMGPKLQILPKKMWLLGLGHLGQAYSWTLSMLPYPNSGSLINVQDFDVLVEANYSAGLLSNEDIVGQKKARVVSEFLENRGFRSNIIEKPFDSNTVPASDEPDILIGGLDKADVRRGVQVDKYHQYLDCGLGGSLGNFDSISLFNFPYCNKTPVQVWSSGDKLTHSILKELESKEFNCGTLAEKAISTSFVGATASTLLISELLRLCHKGKIYGEIDLSIRDLSDRYVNMVGEYSNEIANTGYLEVLN